MKIKLAAVICMITMLVSSSAFAYSRDSQGYGGSDSESREMPAEEEAEEMAEAEAIMRDAPQEAEEKPYRDIQESEGEPDFGMSGMQIGGYVLVTIGGLAAITGSTMLSTSSHKTLGAIIMGSGAAMGLGGSLMIMFGGRSYAVVPRVDPKSGTYGVMLSKRF